MFRVTRAEDPSRTVITIDGDLSGDSIEFVESCCMKEISAGKLVTLLLRDLTTIDLEGRALLARLARRGVRLLASGVYNSYIVQALTPPDEGESLPSGI